MNKQQYKNLRNAYYAGIFVLVIYALQGINFINQYVAPILNHELVPKLTVITLIALLTGVGAFSAYKYRLIG